MIVENQSAFLSSFRQNFMMNRHNFFQSSLNIDESENFSDFETDDRFMLSSIEKIKINVYETLNSAISVQSFFIIANRV